MSHALYSEATLFSITILLVISYKSTFSAFDRSLGKKLFTAALWCSVAAIASEFLWSLSLIDGVTFPKALLWIFNFMYFAFFELSAYLWYPCVDSISPSPSLNSVKRLLSRRNSVLSVFASTESRIRPNSTFSLSLSS